MPVPVSDTDRVVVAPVPSAGFGSAISMIILPPSGIASLALTARLTMTCSSWPGSAST